MLASIEIRTGDGYSRVSQQQNPQETLDSRESYGGEGPNPQEGTPRQVLFVADEPNYEGADNAVRMDAALELRLQQRERARDRGTAQCQDLHALVTPFDGALSETAGAVSSSTPPASSAPPAPTSPDKYALPTRSCVKEIVEIERLERSANSAVAYEVRKQQKNRMIGEMAEGDLSQYPYPYGLNGEAHEARAQPKVPDLDFKTIVIPKWPFLKGGSHSDRPTFNSQFHLPSSLCTSGFVRASIERLERSATAYRRQRWQNARKMEEMALQECLRQEASEAERSSTPAQPTLEASKAVRYSKPGIEASKRTTRTVNATFSVLCAPTHFGEEVRLVGNVATLGQWDPSRAVPMQWTDGHIWLTGVELEFPSAESGETLEYKYVVMSGKHQRWESCYNRVISQPPFGSALICRNVWNSR